MEFLLKKTKDNPTGLIDIEALKRLLLDEEVLKLKTIINSLKEEIKDIKKM